MKSNLLPNYMVRHTKKKKKKKSKYLYIHICIYSINKNYLNVRNKTFIFPFLLCDLDFIAYFCEYLSIKLKLHINVVIE